MDAVLCSDAIIKLFTVLVWSIALGNDNITLISRPESNGLAKMGHFGPFCPPHRAKIDFDWLESILIWLKSCSDGIACHFEPLL
jgi:hypothetical protein